MNPVTGGPCRGIRDSIAEFTKLGVTNEVVCVDDPTESFLNQDHFIIHALGPGRSSWAYSSRLLPWLIDNLLRFDIVIVNGLWLYPNYAVWQAIQQLELRSSHKCPKYFVMPHGMLDPYFQSTNSRKIKAWRNWFYWKLIEHKVVNKADGLLFTSETELRLARKPFYPYQPKHEINIGFGIVEPPPFSIAMTNAFLEKCPQVTDRPYLLFLSRINYKKGVDLLINAYIAIVAAQPEAKQDLPLLVIAGPGLDTPYGETIRRLIQKHPTVKGMVCFPGMLTGNAKWGAIYGCEAFSLPSHQENFGIVVAEALACSKPVLISNQVNIWREIVQGGSGIIGDDSLESTQQVIELWFSMQKHEQRSMAQNARKTFEDYFQMAQAIHRLNNVFETLS